MLAASLKCHKHKYSINGKVAHLVSAEEGGASTFYEHLQKNLHEMDTSYIERVDRLIFAGGPKHKLTDTKGSFKVGVKALWDAENEFMCSFAKKNRQNRQQYLNVGLSMANKHPTLKLLKIELKMYNHLGWSDLHDLVVICGQRKTFKENTFTKCTFGTSHAASPGTPRNIAV